MAVEEQVYLSPKIKSVILGKFILCTQQIVSCLVVTLYLRKSCPVLRGVGADYLVDDETVVTA